MSGRFVAFLSNRTYAPGPSASLFDTYVRDRLLGTTRRVNVEADGTIPNVGGAAGPSVARRCAIATSRRGLALAGSRRSLMDARAGVCEAFAQHAASSARTRVRARAR